tara:strand:+ start:206 stop:382 length:177 start_codon:yes stop_codon:yes gene_type:complete
MMMAKKKKYVPRKDDGWDIEADKQHRKTIAEREKNITEKYRKWWDDEKRGWRKGFDGH